MSDNHEHVLVFGKSDFRFSGTEKSFELYRHWDAAKKDWFRTGGDLTKAHNRFERPNTYYPLHDPISDIWYPCNPDSVWRYSSVHRTKDVKKLRTMPMEDFIAQGYIHFPSEQRTVVWDNLNEVQQAVEAGDVPSSGRSPMLRIDTPDLDFWVGKRVGFGTPSLKRYKSELKNPSQPLSSWVTPNFEANADTISDDQQIVAGTNMEAAKEIKSVFGSKAFNYAKPPSLIRELVRQSTSPNDLVLDFFAGSATTAQTVMELNAEDGGDRRFIMVSSTEATENDPNKNICRDVTAERVRRLNASDDKKYADLAAGFAYLRTKQIDFEDLDYDLNPSDAWTCLEAFHGLPLTPYDPDQPWNIHEGDGATLVLVDRFDLSLIEWLRPRTLQNVHVYAWAPGQIKQHLDGMHIDVSPVRETLVKAFRA